eukprot:CAMPEP_0184476980 /NCGR_PEP_ID=MMETSP0740-20130409/147362_1 /TAXON_ID=385413 /ORGANISM="Thalassiosira miniscula, Strain CCMP1093" /LENGTH=86 /DNA_ID=CAMNT_0026854553 /DNA_START=625 /DNA_END=885 /DNA_ORIENTATION=+
MSLWVGNAYFGPAPDHCGDEGQAWGIPHVICVGFEGHAQHTNGFAVEAAVTKIQQLVHHAAFDLFVDGNHGFCDLHRHRMILPNAG